MPLPDHLELRMVESSADLRDFWDWLSRPRRLLGVDTENSGLSPERDYIRLVQFGDKDMGWAMAWQDWRGVAREVIRDYTGDLAFHNSKYDIRMLVNDLGMSVNDWPWHRTEDGMGLAHIWDSQRPKGLKPLGDRLIDRRISAAQKTLDDAMKKNGWDWATVPINFPPYWQYGALDPVVSVYICELLLDKDVPKDLYDIEMGSTRVAAKMEELGMHVDRAYSIETTNKLDRYASDARQYLLDQWGIENPGSNDQLLNFFQSNHIPLLDKGTNKKYPPSQGGRQSVDKHVLATTDHPVAQTVLNMRKAEKRSGYLHQFLNFADSNGFLHPNINVMAARTGRMSITDPALQTLPRKDPIVRDAIIPREGHTLMTIDADQIEMRLTAHFSGDQGLINAFYAPDDFFCILAEVCFGYPVTKGMIERDLIKGVGYGKVYGASVMTMAETAGRTPQEMSKTNALFDTNYPGVHIFMNQVIQEGKRRRSSSDDGRGYVTTPYGRTLKADNGREYALVNYLIQCHASEILKKKLVELDAVLPSDVKILLPIHDEIIFDVPTEMIGEIHALALEVLNDSAEYRVPISWGADIMPPGESWGWKYRKKPVMELSPE